MSGAQRADAPSGRQYELALGDQLAVVTEVGAALRTYSVGGRQVIVPFGVEEMSPAYHGAVLLPWPNRIGDGRYDFGSRTYQLPLDEPRRGTALHGLASWERWSLIAQSDTEVTLALATVATPGYPFPLLATITYALTHEGLGITLTARNLGPVDAPYGAGFHPWLSPGPGALDDCVLRIDASTWVEPDDRRLPAGYRPIPTQLDFSTPRRVGATVLDDAFVDATFVEDRSWVRLRGPDGLTAAVWMDRSMSCWQVCSGDEIGHPAYDRAGLAVEPMTCVADAFRTTDRLITLRPGESHTVRWGLRLEPAEAGESASARTGVSPVMRSQA